MTHRRAFVALSFFAITVLLGVLVASYGAGDDEGRPSPVSLAEGQDVTSSVSLLAMQTPSPTATPQPPDATPTGVAVRLTAIAGDREQPRFVGVLNGVQFVRGDAPTAPIGACTRDSLRQLPPLEVGRAIEESRLNFESPYLPAGFELGIEDAFVCGEELVTAGRAYANDGGLPLSITRIAGPPVFDSVAPAHRMEPRSFGGRPGVLIHPINPQDVALIFMYDGETSWIVATPAGVDQLVMVATSVKPALGLGPLGK